MFGFLQPSQETTTLAPAKILHFRLRHIRLPPAGACVNGEIDGRFHFIFHACSSRPVSALSPFSFWLRIGVCGRGRWR